MAAPLEPAEAIPAPTENPPPPSAVAAPSRDASVEPAQNRPLANARAPVGGVVGEKDPGLPAAKEAPGRPAPPGGAMEPEKFVLSPESLPLGKQAIGLTVEVKGPPTINLNKEAIYRIIVSNTGSVDATDVTVRDVLPPGMEFVSSQPQEQRGPDSLFFWRLSTVAAGSEQVITLRVRPTQVGRFDHAATVTARAGAKTSTRVFEPRLKIEQTATTEKVLKNRPVEFRIAVTNVGDGPARNVVVVAKLSRGLKGDTGDGSAGEANLFELDLGEIAPNQRIELDPLVADTIQGGAQSCQVKALSPDVQAGAPEAENTRQVSVVEPKLKLTLNYPEKRFTETIGSYSIAIENDGSAAARNVEVVATLPIGGRLVDQLTNGARYDPQTRTLRWPKIQLEPGANEKVTYPFQVRMGGPGVYQVSAQARADGVPQDKKVGTTDVIGMADIDLEIIENRRVMDVDDFTTFTVRIKNVGSKDAEHLLISARHSDNLKVTETAGTDAQAEYSRDKPGEFKFPMIARLGKGQSTTLGIKVQALRPGQATCRVYLLHDEVPKDQALEDLAQVRITEAHAK